jgi:hypothetical protein
MNVFEIINKYNKSNITTYGDLLSNKTNQENNLLSNEKQIYNELKYNDVKRFKINENKNLMNNINVSQHPAEIPGIGKVIQIC